MVHPSQRRSPYSARRPAWCLTFRCGDTTRSYPIRPFLAGSALGIFVLLLTAYVGATAYLIYRDDLLGAAVSRQVKMQYAYEERIAALRSELDRLTSRHLVQTESVEQQLSTLLEQQALIERRQSALDELVGKARAAGVDVADGEVRVPRPRHASEEPNASAEGTGAPPASYAPFEPADDDVISRTLTQHGRSDRPTALNGNIRPLLSHVRASLDDAETAQSQALDTLSAEAEGAADRVSKALVSIGLEAGGSFDQAAEPQGGPFIPMAGLHFVERTAVLDRWFDDIETRRRSAEAMPLGVPVSALYVSSRFGYRLDPFLRRPAFHAGLDFVAPAGTTVYATAPGTVVSAAWNGGYGNMVEIKHADGVSTRYGHLSEILVTPGTPVSAGAAIGRVGSTGRSTGPHLHYETRRDGEAINPALYLAAGKVLRSGS